MDRNDEVLYSSALPENAIIYGGSHLWIISLSSLNLLLSRTVGYHFVDIKPAVDAADQQRCEIHQQCHRSLCKVSAIYWNAGLVEKSSDIWTSAQKTFRLTPDIQLASSDARKRAARARSSGIPRPRKGCRLRRCLWTSGLSSAFCV